MLRRLLGLIRKEFAQILMDRALVLILIWAFTAAIYTRGCGGSVWCLRSGTSSILAMA